VLLMCNAPSQQHAFLLQSAPGLFLLLLLLLLLLPLPSTYSCR
jgi:hypothetical protein